MSKGQRGNKESKKPKQDRASPRPATPGQPAPATSPGVAVAVAPKPGRR